ncbi:MAG: T9SS type A sorting domain-containing protein [Chlorobi bacterium]|nr:T9SS type A sorting domain-containing protein [Chlorobiota bacterium]
MGQHVKHFAVYQREAKLVLNSTHSNHVVIIDCFSKAVEAKVDVGESAESLALNTDGTMLYIADRLGDENGIARVRLSDNRLMMLRSGNWPVMIAYDAGLRALFSIDHLQSSLSVFDDGEVLPSDTIDIPGVLEARTDALSHLSLDPTTHTLLVCIPEAETWALVDGNTRTVIKTGKVDGYTYRDYGGVGYLQGIIAPDVKYFFVLRLADKMLNIYDLRDGTFLQEVNLKTLPWRRMRNTLGELMWYDSVDKVLYIGPTPFDVRTRTLSSSIVPGSSRIIGRTRDDKYLVGLQVDDSVRIVLHQTRSKRIARIASLYPFWYGTPVVLFDRDRDRLFLAEFQFAIVREYNLAGITSVRRVQSSPSFELEPPYPQPVGRGQVATVDITLEPRANNGPVTLEVLDVFGRSVKTIAAGSDGTGSFRVRIPTRDLAPGMYFYRLKAPVYSVVRKLVVR